MLTESQLTALSNILEKSGGDTRRKVHCTFRNGSMVQVLGNLQRRGMIEILEKGSGFVDLKLTGDGKNYLVKRKGCKPTKRKASA